MHGVPDGNGNMIQVQDICLNEHQNITVTNQKPDLGTDEEASKGQNISETRQGAESETAS